MILIKAYKAFPTKIRIKDSFTWTGLFTILYYIGEFEMIIGKGTSEDRIVTTEVDFSRNIVCNSNGFAVPTKVSIIYIGGQYFCRCDVKPFTCFIPVYYGKREYVKWKDKIYCVDTPEKFAILKNIIETEFAICQLK